MTEKQRKAFEKLGIKADEIAEIGLEKAVLVELNGDGYIDVAAKIAGLEDGPYSATITAKVDDDQAKKDIAALEAPGFKKITVSVVEAAFSSEIAARLSKLSSTASLAAPIASVSFRIRTTASATLLILPSSLLNTFFVSPSF